LILLPEIKALEHKLCGTLPGVRAVREMPKEEA
jgi:hypothetical protein